MYSHDFSTSWIKSNQNYKQTIIICLMPWQLYIVVRRWQLPDCGFVQNPFTHEIQLPALEEGWRELSDGDADTMGRNVTSWDWVHVHVTSLSIQNDDAALWYGHLDAYVTIAQRQRVYSVRQQVYCHQSLAPDPKVIVVWVDGRTPTRQVFQVTHFHWLKFTQTRNCFQPVHDSLTVGGKTLECIRFHFLLFEVDFWTKVLLPPSWLRLDPRLRLHTSH